MVCYNKNSVHIKFHLTVSRITEQSVWKKDLQRACKSQSVKKKTMMIWLIRMCPSEIQKPLCWHLAIKGKIQKTHLRRNSLNVQLYRFIFLPNKIQTSVIITKIHSRTSTPWQRIFSKTCTKYFLCDIKITYPMNYWFPFVESFY